jgi:large subunit ribosomal protein L6
MSRIGRMPIPVPGGVTVTIDSGDVTVKGPRGELSRNLSSEMTISLAEDVLTVTRPSDDREHRSLHGLTRTLLANMVEGVTSGFEKTLEIVGVGYRVVQKDDNLVINIGFSHPVEVVPLPGVALVAEGNNRMKVSGINKEDVGEMAARIRAIRPPDSYKGKGIRYAGEVVRLKPGKAGKAIGR